MTQSEMLQKLLDKAVEAKWMWRYGEIASDAVTNPNAEDEIIISLEISPADTINTITLLFGDNLSFLKALFAIYVINENNEEIGLLFNMVKKYKDATINPVTDYVVKRLAVLPDNERVPYLYKLVFKEDV